MRLEVFPLGTVFSIERTLELHWEGKKMKHKKIVNPLPAYGRLHNTDTLYHQHFSCSQTPDSKIHAVTSIMLTFTSSASLVPPLKRFAICL